MRKEFFVLCAVMLVAALPATAQKVHVDYDAEAMKVDYKTFAWGPTPDTSLGSESPLMHSRIKNAIEYRLTNGGLIEAQEDPDLYVTYHTSSKEELRLNTTSMGYGYGPGWGWDPYWGGRMGMGGMGMGSSTTTATTYERGTLIIDIWDAEKKQAIWRGSAEAVIKQNPQKMSKQIDKMIEKMSKRFQKMQAKDAKASR